MPNIVLHQLEISPFCDKVRRTLHYKGLPFEVRNIPMGELGKLKKLSSIGKVPILEINDDVFIDSSDICYELERRFPEKSILPIAPKEKALVNIMEDWADESLYFFEMTMRFTWTHDRARWVKEILKYDNAIMKRAARPLVPYLTKKQGTNQGLAKRTESQILSELTRHIESLDAILENNSFLVGKQLTLADIAVVSQLECVAGSSKGWPIIENSPRVTSWMKSIEALTGGPAIR